MPWQERLQVAAYTSPLGNSFEFDYENVGLSVSKKTTQFDFPGGNGSYIQDLGHTGKRYKMQLFFHGDDHDIVADEFLAALLEIGVGQLEHPLYGTFDVVPFGEISRRDDLKTAANQSIFDVSFYETTGVVFPNSQDDPYSEINAQIDEYNEVSAEKLDGEKKIENENERLSFKEFFKLVLNGIKTTFDIITQAQKEVNDAFNNVYNSIDGAIDLLIATPTTLAFQTNILLQTPGRLGSSLGARVDGYISLINTLTTGPGSIKETGNDNTGLNDFVISDLYASGALIALIDNVANSEFETKAQALEIAEQLQNTFQEINAWRELNYESLGLIDTSEQYETMQQLVALAAGFLVQISFSLQTERFIVLDRNRTIIDLVAELYGEIDEKLDFFIDSNDLSGDEIVELPRGKTVVYFI